MRILLYGVAIILMLGSGALAATATDEVVPTNAATVMKPCLKPVSMILVSWCPYCKAAREFFRENNIPYEAIDAETFIGPLPKWFKVREGYPQFLLGKKRYVGFDEDTYRELFCVVPKSALKLEK